MALSINEVKNGITILADDQAWIVVDAQHVKPGKGAAFVRAKLRNIRTGAIQEKTFRGDEKIEEAYIEERKIQFLYKTGDMFHFMDQENYEEVAIQSDVLGDKVKFLKDNLDVVALFYKNDCLAVNLPFFIEFEIKHTEPGIKGDTAKSGTKPAEIDTGATIQVPLFINEGDHIKIDTRTGGYVERIN
ncbi:MAG TPA: elongation factor P [Candidatus Omnitrophota bacterium]|nr:elongation factor P [Candidatus Omnitrophota bacterium]HPT07627.1 elongation factor P [Candidatus Omnitrophota bacterium]